MSDVHVVEVDHRVQTWTDLHEAIESAPDAFVVCVHWDRTDGLADDEHDVDLRCLDLIRSAGRIVVVSVVGAVPADGLRIVLAADVVVSEAGTTLSSADDQAAPWRGISDRAARTPGTAWLGYADAVTAHEAERAGWIDRITTSDARLEAERISAALAERGRSANAEWKALLMLEPRPAAAVRRAEADAENRLSESESPE